MEEGFEFESVLVADCGSTTTRAALIDVVGDEFRLLATGETATTVEVPWSRISLGVREAVRQIELLTGRVLLSDNGQLIVPERDDGSGVDGLVATVNAAVPLHVVVVGLIRGLSVESLVKATDCTYVVVQGEIAADDRDGSKAGGGGIAAMLMGSLQDRPDVVLLGGGTDGGAVAPVLDVARDVAAALSALVDGGRAHVVFAGNAALRTDIAKILGECANLRVVDNVRPSLREENLGAGEEELRRLYREARMERAPGFGEFKSWVVAPVMTTAEGFELAVRYLSRLYQLDTLAVDVGSAATHVAGLVGGRFGSTVSAQLGVGYSISHVLDQVGVDRILRWLPFELDPEEARNHLLNKALRPMTVPETEESLFLEQAAAREAIHLTLERARDRWLGGRVPTGHRLMPDVDLIIGRGGVLTRAPSRGQAALILLDAIQPTSVCALALDQASLLPQLGALASVHPLAAAQTMAKDSLLKLGTVISVSGGGRIGHLALKLRIEYDDGQTFTAEVRYGDLEVVPLATGKRAVVELRPSSQFDVGLGAKGRGATTEVDGGALGIIVDARGRPLLLPGDGRTRRSKIREWMAELGP